MRTTILLLMALIIQSRMFGETNYMETFTIAVCGAQVSFDLHPNWEQPASGPRSVKAEEISRPGSAVTFANAMYDYRRAWRWSVDGDVVVKAMVVRQPKEFSENGISEFDLDRLIQIYQERLPGHHHEKVERCGSVWVMRSRMDDVSVGDGRNESLVWLVPVAGDITLVFAVELHDYGRKTTRWYSDATEMQDWIFKSLKVTLSPEAQRERERFLQKGCR